MSTSPARIAVALRYVAAKLDNSKNPSKLAVASSLKLIESALVGKPRTAKDDEFLDDSDLMDDNQGDDNKKDDEYSGWVDKKDKKVKPDNRTYDEEIQEKKDTEDWLKKILWSKPAAKELVRNYDEARKVSDDDQLVAILKKLKEDISDFIGDLTGKESGKEPKKVRDEKVQKGIDEDQAAGDVQTSAPPRSKIKMKPSAPPSKK